MSLRIVTLFAFLIAVLLPLRAYSTGSSLTLSSDQQLSGSLFGLKKVRKQTFNFTGDSSTGSIPTLSFDLEGRVLKVEYVPVVYASPSPVPSGAPSTLPVYPSPVPTVIVADPDTSLDVLNGQCAVTTANTAQNFYPSVSPSPGVNYIKPFINSAAAVMTIKGPTTKSTNGEVIIYSGDADW